MYKFSYMTNTIHFSISPLDVGIAGASSLLGGALYGGTYVGTKKLMGEDMNSEQAKRELAANSTAGAVSGLGCVLKR